MVDDTEYWNENRKIKSTQLSSFMPYQLVSILRGFTSCNFYVRSGQVWPSILYIHTGKLRPVISLLNWLNWATISPIIQWIYLKLPFLRIYPYTVFNRQRVYQVITFSIITYNLILLLNLKQSLVPLLLSWCFQYEKGCYNFESSTYNLLHTLCHYICSGNHIYWGMSNWTSNIVLEWMYHIIDILLCIQ